MRFIVIYILIFLSVLFGGLVFFLKNNQETAVNPVVERIARAVDPPTPTPFPFIEMTVPYLRSRQFVSSLSDLERFASNGNYVSNLTSYDSDGLKINGLLTVPGSDAPPGGHPAIIFIHGYIPPDQYRTTVNYSAYVDYLARNGFAVFKIDLRGHDKSEGEPGGAYYSSDYITDVLNARSALASSDFINPEKIGLWGHSMAGNVVLRSLAAMPDIPAAVIWAGAVYTYSDMQKYGIQDGSYRPPQIATERQRQRARLRELYGEFNPDHFFWSQLAATNYLADLRGSIQLNHAVDDTVVNIGYSRDLAALLNEAGVGNELKEYQSGGHNISGAAFNQAMSNTVEFFKKHL